MKGGRSDGGGEDDGGGKMVQGDLQQSDGG